MTQSHRQADYPTEITPEMIRAAAAELEPYRDCFIFDPETTAEGMLKAALAVWRNAPLFGASDQQS